MSTPDPLLAALYRDHLGAANGIGVKALAAKCCMPQRRVRACVTALRLHGIAVCVHPKAGYYIAANAEELEGTCRFLRQRALGTLLIESRLRRLPLPELLGQLRLAGA